MCQFDPIWRKQGNICRTYTCAVYLINGTKSRWFLGKEKNTQLHMYHNQKDSTGSQEIPTLGIWDSWLHIMTCGRIITLAPDHLTDLAGPFWTGLGSCTRQTPNDTGTTSGIRSCCTNGGRREMDLWSICNDQNVATHQKDKKKKLLYINHWTSPLWFYSMRFGNSSGNYKLHGFIVGGCIVADDNSADLRQTCPKKWPKNLKICLIILEGWWTYDDRI